MNKYKESFYNMYYDYNGNKIIYNFVSGSGAYIDKKTLATIKSGANSDTNTQRTLAKLGFIVPFEVNEFLRLKELSMGEIWSLSPKSLLFVITPSMGCNLNCEYCFESYEIRKNNPPIMSNETQNKIIDFITNKIVRESCKLLKSVSISFFGGEPTLNIDIIIKISSAIRDICKKYGIAYDARIITNGILLTNDNGSKLKESGVTIAQITLDGLAEDYAEKKGISTDIFEKVLRNISDNSDILKLRIRINVDNDNKGNIPKLMELLLNELGLNEKIYLYFSQIKKWNEWNNNNKISFITSEDYGNCLEKYLDFAFNKGWIKSIIQNPPKMKSTACGMIRSGSIGIGYDGSLYRCTHGFSNPLNCKVGDIETGLSANIYDFNFKNWSEDEKCSQCKYFPVCWGGCRNNIMLYNDSPNCNLVKKENDLCVLYSFKAKDSSM